MQWVIVAEDCRVDASGHEMSTRGSLVVSMCALEIPVLFKLLFKCSD